MVERSSHTYYAAGGELMRILLASRVQDYQPVYDFLREKRYEVVYTENRFDLPWLQAQGIDCIVSYCYGPIIKPPVITVYKQRIVNIHNSYLPYGRGILPNVWSFFKDTPKGVSLHFIDEGIDTGHIIVRKLVRFDEKETLASSHAKLMDCERKLFYEYADAIFKGDVVAVPQATLGEAGSYHSRSLSLALMELFPLKWDTPVGEVERMGRIHRESGVRLEEFIAKMKEGPFRG